MAHVGAVAGGPHHPQRAAGNLVGHVVANAEWGDRVLRTLEDQRRGSDLREIATVVGVKGGLRKSSCDVRIRRAEALLQLATELRAILILHHDRRQEASPAE